jgi:hypothetical protein
MVASYPATKLTLHQSMLGVQQLFDTYRLKNDERRSMRPVPGLLVAD